jgi:caspase domain-containing protein
MERLARRLVAAACLLAPLAARADERPPRIALVVGANGAPPGRKPLLFGHRDAENMADVLTSVGGFRAQDVSLLEDPSPAVLLAAVEDAIARLTDKPHAVLYFYYSGHADETSLYPGGAPLPVARLRRLIDDAHVATKIGLVDACRGGGWTRAKGLVPDQPFAVHWPVSLDSEGSVLIASSSGLESAHESDQLQGSFFTFHFAAGLRGAADGNGNNEVTLTEAFEYAKERTIRDTLRQARETQHPSYALNLRGSRDLVLANVNASPTTVEVSEREGPLQLIHADSGLQLLEIPAGHREIRLAVPPGRYVIRRTGPGGNLIKEITVVASVRNRFDEEQLALVGNARLTVKDPEPPPFVIVHPRAHLRPPPPEASPGVKAGFWTSAVVTTAAAALFVKFNLDTRNIDKDLDPYRRFPCVAGMCDAMGMPLRPLNTLESQYVKLKKDDAARLERFATGSLIVTGVGAVATGIFLWQWKFADHEAPKKVALLPLSPAGAPGLTLAWRM